MSDQHTTAQFPAGKVSETTQDDPTGYAAWFQRELEIGLKEADDPNTKWISLEESNEKMRLLRAARDRAVLEKAS